MNERRQAARVPPDGIRCCGGRIIDFSVRGMRICTRRPWAEGERRTILVRKGLRIANVTAVCVWTRKDGPFRHAVGLAFADITPQVVAQLSAMMTSEENPMRRAA